MNFTHRVRRTCQKLGIFLLRSLSTKEEIYHAEREASSICRYLLKDPDSEVLSSPLSQKFYLKSDKKRMLLVLDSYGISIVNHVYGYNVQLSKKMHQIIEDEFLAEIDSRRVKMEEEYKSNIKHSLQYIAKSLKNENVH
jgi:hypothetical protein